MKYDEMVLGKTLIVVTVSVKTVTFVHDYFSCHRRLSTHGFFRATLTIILLSLYVVKYTSSFYADVCVLWKTALPYSRIYFPGRLTLA